MFQATSQASPAVTDPAPVTRDRDSGLLPLAVRARTAAHCHRRGRDPAARRRFRRRMVMPCNRRISMVTFQGRDNIFGTNKSMLVRRFLPRGITSLSNLVQKSLSNARLDPRMCVRNASGSPQVGSKVPPHGGGALVDRMVYCEKERAEQVRSCNGLTLELSERQSCDVELITTGAFSPIEGFMNEDVW